MAFIVNFFECGKITLKHTLHWETWQENKKKDNQTTTTAAAATVTAKT